MNNNSHKTALIALLTITTLNVLGTVEIYAPNRVEERLIDHVWVANKVSFDLHTIGNRQFVAYYDEDRNMSVASRALGSDSWRKTILPSKLMWDSHNYVAMGIDEEGYIHVSGNMHTHPLDYFRSEKPYDVTRMLHLNRMVGEDEDSVTYPKFFHDKNGSLLFSYRAGTCGNGNVLINRYLPESNKWERYLKVPLFEGIEADDDRAAYHSFTRDAEGNFHVIWMWRWTPMVETSHQLCYAFSPDFIHWKNAAGKTVSLPFRPDAEDLIVDNAASKGGMHNGRFKIILTEDETPVIGYVKYNEEGLTQLYLARFKDGKWFSRQISDWDFRWKFVEGGDQMTVGGSFSFSGLSDDGMIVIEWRTEKNDSGYYVVDPESFAHVEKEVRLEQQYPNSIRARMSEAPGMSVNLMPGKGHEVDDESRYLLKWESMKKSHGRHAPEIIPDGPISELLLLKVSQ